MTLVWAPGYNGVTDPDAQTYLAAVEAADGQAIEGDVALAINDFVVGCKLDGIWDAIKASCILAGARTLSGALVPLVGTAPTNNNFVAGDYDRETGLKGDGSTKYLDSNRANSSSPQNNVHVSTHVNTADSGTNFGQYIGQGATNSGAIRIGNYNATPPGIYFLNRSAVTTRPFTVRPTGFHGTSRSNSTSFSGRLNGASLSVNAASQAPAAQNILVFADQDNSGSLGGEYSNARLSFYSIGESLDLAALDNRVTTLMTDIGAAIP